MSLVLIWTLVHCDQFLNVMYKWYLMFVLLCLTYWTWCDHLTVHSCCCKWRDFLLFPGRVLIHWVHVAYPHPFICGWSFQCAHALAIVNSATNIVGVLVSFGRMVFSRHAHPGVKSWNLMGALFFFFLRDFYTVPHSDCYHYIFPPAA